MKLTITYPDGTTYTRDSVRLFTHCVVYKDGERWKCPAWSRNESLARKSRAFREIPGAQIVPVVPDELAMRNARAFAHYANLGFANFPKNP
jgi:hypothetical protein